MLPTDLPVLWKEPIGSPVYYPKHVTGRNISQSSSGQLPSVPIHPKSALYGFGTQSLPTPHRPLHTPLTHTPGQNCSFANSY